MSKRDRPYHMAGELQNIYVAIYLYVHNGVKKVIMIYVLLEK